MMQYKKTAAQKRWHDAVASQGCILGIDTAEIHHVVGASYKHNKVWIGQWYVLPLSYWCHRDPKNEFNVTDNKYGFEAHISTQKDLFTKVCQEYWYIRLELPFGSDVYHAIMSCGR